MPMFPYPEFKPDSPGLDQSGSSVISNVLPTATGYAPFPGLAVYSEALDEEPAGGLSVRGADGTYYAFVGTATKIWMLSGTTWEDVSKSGGYNLADGDRWSKAQFGNYVVFTNVNDPPQVFETGVSTDFADLGGDPENVRHVAVSGDYLMLMSTASDPNKFWRSGNNRIDWWTPGRYRSDFQALPTGGTITGMAGFERGAIVFSETSIRLLQDEPGSAALFSLSITEPTRGVVAPDSIVQVGNRTFFLSEDGFFEFSAAGSVPIGAERVDRWFLRNLDASYITLVQGAADPINKVIVWLWLDNAGSKRFLGYSWQLNKWFDVETDAGYLLAAASSGYTLETVEAAFGYTNLEQIPFSLDARFLKGGRPTFGAFNAAKEFCFFNGPNLEATLETPDVAMGGEGHRCVVSGWRPIDDAVGVGALGRAETFGAANTFTTEAAQNSTGLIPQRGSGRTVRFRRRIPAGTEWTFAIGVEVPPEAARRAGRR